MIDIGTSYLFVLNAGSTGQASISSYSMNNTISANGFGDGSLTPNGSPTPAGFDAAGIGTDVQSFNGKNPGDQYFYVADAGSQTIDEYEVPGSGLPEYIGAIPSRPGALAFGSGSNGCFLACANAHVEFETLTLPNATASTPYSYTIPLGPSNLNPYTDMTIYSGSLPPGFTLNQFTGAISGTGSSIYAGTYTFGVEEYGVALVGEFSITVLPAGSSSSSSQTQSTSVQSTSSSSTCGRGCSPPGMHGLWATSNSTVGAVSDPHPTDLDQAKGIDVSWIQLESNPSGQVIQDVAYNQSVLQVQFNKPGLIVLSLESTQPPVAVYSDGIPLQAAALQDISFSDQGFYYNQTSHVMTIFADPSAITLFYGLTPRSSPSSSTGSTVTSATPASTTSSTTAGAGLPLIPLTIVVVAALILVGALVAWRGGLFGDTYAKAGGITKTIPVDIFVPDCPPRPKALLCGLLLAVDRGP